MKYIYFILGIILLISCAYGVISYKGSGEPPGENALVVNERVIPFAELQQMWQQKPYHYRDQNEFIDDLVLREVLIQEAINGGIADEDQFKRLIKDFFEQSLVKTLLDRKQLEQPIELSEPDLANFRKAQHLRYRLTLLRYQSYQQALAGEAAQEQQLIEDFVVLPEALQVRLLSMRSGELSTPFADGADYVRIQIDQIDKLPQLQESVISDDELRQHLHYLLQQKILEEWILRVREQAIVRYPQQKLKNGGE